jgi:hypothetical protein
MSPPARGSFVGLCSIETLLDDAPRQGWIADHVPAIDAAAASDTTPLRAESLGD